MNYNPIRNKYCKIEKYIPPTTLQTNDKRLHLNENLFGPSKSCIEALKSIEANDLCMYDLTASDDLIQTISNKLGLDADKILVHSGSAEMIKCIFNLLFSSSKKSLLVPSQSWKYYKSLANCNFAVINTFDILEDEINYTFAYSSSIINKRAKETSADLIVLTSPNMPTGNLLSSDELISVLTENPSSVIMVDEAYWGYSMNNDVDVKRLVAEFDNLIIVRTFSKFFGLANERVGYCYCNNTWKCAIESVMPLFKISYTSRVTAIAALNDLEYYYEVRDRTIQIRNKFIDKLNTIRGVIAYKSEANFVYLRIESDNNDKILMELKNKGYIIREFKCYNDIYRTNIIYIRITISKEEYMNEIVQTIHENI